MRFSVIEFTTPHLSFREDLAVYREGGADGIGISEEKLTDDREDLELLRTSGLRAASFFPSRASILPSPLLPGRDDPEARIADLCGSVRRLAPFEPDCCF